MDEKEPETQEHENPEEPSAEETVSEEEVPVQSDQPEPSEEPIPAESVAETEKPELAEEPEKTLEKKEPEELRIGVFVCHCGVNIGGFVDVPRVAEYAKTLPNVAHAENNLFTCAEDGLVAIKTAIKEHNLNRVIVASCTPRTHAPLFQSVCEEAGLNKYLFTFSNIREHCSWVHMKEPEKATVKAQELIRMAVARATLLEPQDEVKVDVEPLALVLGGGVSGMMAAINLANQGFETHLVEKEAELGGFIRNLHTLYQTGKDANESIKPLIEQVKSNDKIHLHLESQLTDLEGFIGNYNATITSASGDEKKVKFGTIIVATGAEEYKPEGLYGYGEYDNVITLTDFEKKSNEGTIPENLKNVAFIQCVGSRGQDKEYCSRICCNIAVKNALKLVGADLEEITANLTKTGAGSAAEPEGTGEPEKAVEEAAAPPIAAETEEPAKPEEAEVSGGRRDRRERRGRRERRERRERPAAREEAGEAVPAAGGPAGMEVTIFNRGMTTYGVEHELLFNKAREHRVKFTRFVPDNVPKVTEEDGKLCLSYYHETLQTERKMYPDLIVLATPLVQRPEAEKLSKILKVPLGQDKFFLEAHVKLRPVDFATDGIFLCGTCHAPADITESVAQALGAASRAGIPLTKGYVQAEAITALVNPELCCGCKTCEPICPYGAIQVKNLDVGKKAEVIIAACKGCGSCASICPEGAITMRNYTDEQLISEGIAALREVTQ